MICFGAVLVREPLDQTFLRPPQIDIRFTPKADVAERKLRRCR
jgi:hypothetical protein